MILDEIYEAIRIYRKEDEICPFPAGSGFKCEWCNAIFPEALSIDCPCLMLNYDYVKSEMRRLFP